MRATDHVMIHPHLMPPNITSTVSQDNSVAVGAFNSSLINNLYHSLMLSTL